MTFNKTTLDPRATSEVWCDTFTTLSHPDIATFENYSINFLAQVNKHSSKAEDLITKKNNERIILCPISLFDVNSRPRHCTLARADEDLITTLCINTFSGIAVTSMTIVRVSEEENIYEKVPVLTLVLHPWPSTTFLTRLSSEPSRMRKGTST
jgi:hypothetical protein